MAGSAPSAVADPDALLGSYTQLADEWLDIVVDELGYDDTALTRENVLDVYAQMADLDLGPFFDKAATRASDVCGDARVRASPRLPAQTAPGACVR